MTKVLFIGSYLSRHRGTKGVSESIAEKLLPEGVDVEISSKFEHKLLRILDIIWKTLRFSGNKVNIDVFSGQAFNIALIASKVAFFRNKEIILTLHGGKLPEFHKAHLNKIEKLFSRSKYIQTPSLYLIEHFEQKGYSINYLPNALDLSSFPYKRAIDNPYSLLWVRAFTSIYNPDLAIKTLHAVRMKYPSCTLTMIGPDKGLLRETMKLADDLSLKEFVFFEGPVPNNELYKYYQTHGVFLNTTSYESFGVAVAEAASCGIPTVSTKVGEIPYLWKHDEDMLLVDCFDHLAFTGQVIRLFENEELAKKLSLNARQKAETFDWEKIKTQWIKLLTA